MVEENENVDNGAAIGKTSVFLAWSGPVSKKMAGLLKDQLPLLVRNIDIFLSEDTTKGKRWHTEIANALGSTKFGILCLTPENLASEWIHFEAGALSKTIDESTHVCPLLLDVKKSELKEPLASFQASIFEKEEFKTLVTDLSRACGDTLRELQRDKLMDALWPEIDKSIKILKAELAVARKKSGEPEHTKTKIDPLLEEIVVRIREQGRLLATLAAEQDGADIVFEIRQAAHDIITQNKHLLHKVEMDHQSLLLREREEDNALRGLDKLRAYKDSYQALHGISHAFRDHMQGQSNKTKLETGYSHREFCLVVLDNLKDIFQGITGVRCSTTIKAYWKEEDIMVTVGRDSISAAERALIDQDRISSVDGNTASLRIIRDHERHFFSNDLITAFENGEFINDRPDWQLYYNSMICWPIRHYNPKTKKTNIFGLLCIDSLQKNAFDKYVCLQIGACISDLIYSYFSNVKVEELLSSGVIVADKGKEAKSGVTKKADSPSGKFNIEEIKGDPSQVKDRQKADGRNEK